MPPACGADQRRISGVKTRKHLMRNKNLLMSIRQCQSRTVCERGLGTSSSSSCLQGRRPRHRQEVAGRKGHADRGLGPRHRWPRPKHQTCLDNWEVTVGNAEPIQQLRGPLRGRAMVTEGTQAYETQHVAVDSVVLEVEQAWAGGREGVVGVKNRAHTMWGMGSSCNDIHPAVSLFGY
jgi:hypothetical protein